MSDSKAQPGPTATDTRALALASMEQECPERWTEALNKPLLIPHPAHCESCRGIGKVFLFDDSVRVPCGLTHSIMPPDLSSIRNCSCAEVGCRGWTPSLDRRVWEPALATAHFHVYLTFVDECQPRVQVVLCSNQEWPEGSAEIAADAEALLMALVQKEPRDVS